MAKTSFAWPFFLLPFFLIGGAFSQALGLYLCAILIPAFHSLHSARYQAPDLWRHGGLLISLFLIFTLANLVNLGQPLSGTIAGLSYDQSGLSWKKLFDSRLSSAVFISGIFLLLFGLKQRLARPYSKEGSDREGRSFTSFHFGMGFAVLLLGVYAAVQHLWGIDIKASNWRIHEAKHLASGGYRVLGFFGHPLSFAAFSLAGFAFYWALFGQLAKKLYSASGGVFPLSQLLRLYLMIAMLFFVFIFLAGGRAAVVVAVAFMFGYPIYLFREVCFRRQTWTKTRNLWLLFLGLVISIAALFLSGLVGRFFELWNDFQSSHIDRFSFWQVYWQMFLDKPWLGHGPAFIDMGERLLYYNQLGFADLRDKYNAHNVYLETLASVGIIGSLAILVTLFALLKGLYTRSANAQYRVYWEAFVVALLANFAHGLSQNTFFDSNVMYLYLAIFWLLIWDPAPKNASTPGTVSLDP